MHQYCTTVVLLAVEEEQLACTHSVDVSFHTSSTNNNKNSSQITVVLLGRASAALVAGYVSNLCM